MAEIEVRISPDLIRAIDPKTYQRALRLGTEDATAMLLERMRTYPKKSAGKKTFVSDKQRRFFFWALNAGVITVPYRRTRTAAKSWSRQVRVSGGNVTGIVGSNSNIAPYNRYLYDADMPQARIHRGNWQTVQGVAQRSERQVRAMYDARIRAATR